MTRHSISAILVFLGCCVLTTQSSAQDVLSDRLRDCAALEDNDARVRCYDAIARQETPGAGDAQRAPAAASGSVDPAAIADSPDVDPGAADASTDMDDVGREQLPGSNESDDVEYRARVTRCEETKSGQVYFFLENGQIWKQKDYKRVRYRDCEFDVSLTKDLIGYKLKIVDTKHSFRVARVK